MIKMYLFNKINIYILGFWCLSVLVKNHIKHGAVCTFPRVLLYEIRQNFISKIFITRNNNSNVLVHTSLG